MSFDFTFTFQNRCNLTYETKFFQYACRAQLKSTTTQNLYSGKVTGHQDRIRDSERANNATEPM